MLFSFICDTQMLESIKDCFVTGSWADDEDAAKLLANDGKTELHLPSFGTVFANGCAVFTRTWFACPNTIVQYLRSI